MGDQDQKAKLQKLKDDIAQLRATKQNGGMEGTTSQNPNMQVSIRLRRALKGHFGKVYACMWAGAGAAEEIVSASQDGKLIIWNANTTYKKQAIPLRSSWVMTCAFEETTNNYVACGGLDNLCSVYKVDADPTSVSRATTELSGHDGYLSCCRFIDDKRIVSSSGDSQCIVWDIEAGEQIQSHSDHNGDVMSVAISPTDKNLFVSGSCDVTCKLWDIRVKMCVSTFSGHESDINAVSFFPDGMAFGTGSDDSSCRLFDLRCYQEVNHFASDRILCGITSVAFSSSGRLLFAGYDDYTTHAWDVTKCNQRTSAYNSGSNGHENRVSCLGVSSNGNALCTGSWDTTLKVHA